MRTILLLSITTALLAQGQESLLKYTFDAGTEGWIVLGQNGEVKVSKEAKTGAGALEFSYSLDKGFTAAVVPVGEGKLAGMKRIRFWVKSDHDTSLGVLLSEKKPGGGNYISMFWAPRNTWQHVDLALPEFVMNEGPTDPVDADGKLDADQVEGIGIVDVAAVFNQMPADSPMLVERKTGSHTIVLDDLEVLTSAAASTKPNLIDGFDRGFASWLTFGGATIGLAPADNPVGGPALVTAMKASSGKLVLIYKRIAGAAELAGAKRLTFDIASEHEATLVVSMETNKPGAKGGQGPRYNFVIYPSGGRKSARINVSLADFDHDDNSPEDPAGKLEAGNIKSIAIGDITAMTGGAAADNTIWIGRIEMVR